MPITELILAAILLALAGGIAMASRVRRRGWRTARKRACTTASGGRARARERYRTLVAATTDLVVQRDVHGRITYADEGYARLFDRAPADLIGESIEPHVLDGETVSVRADGLRRIETRIIAADGRERWFDVVEVPVRGRRRADAMDARGPGHHRARRGGEGAG